MKTFIFGMGAMMAIATTAYAINGNQDLKAELEAVNRRLENFYVIANADSIVSFYESEFIYMPEYKPSISKTPDLRKFFTGWFVSHPVGSYDKRIYEVEKIGSYILETGTFSMDTHYTGKYMVMWKRSISGNYKIISEAFGSDKYIKPEEVPYAAVEVKENNGSEKNIANPKLLSEIEEFDKGVVKAVLDGDGQARADEFTKDGIYMPHFDPMQVGMDMIRPYMLRTYGGSAIKSVVDTYREIFDLGDFVFLSGHFKVGFDDGTRKGSFEGNMSNLMKRGRDGKLLMYRQLAHN